MAKYIAVFDDRDATIEKDKGKCFALTNVVMGCIPVYAMVEKAPEAMKTILDAEPTCNQFKQGYNQALKDCGIIEEAEGSV